MLKGVGEQNGRKVLIFGLSYVNLERLKDGKPIQVFGEEMGIPYNVVIFAGETEQAMAEVVAGPETIINEVDHTRQ